MKNNQKLKGKDLINIGIYAAIYCVLMTCISMLGYIPIMMPMLTVIVPIILGAPMMLFYTKVKKFGNDHHYGDHCWYLSMRHRYGILAYSLWRSVRLSG